MLDSQGVQCMAAYSPDVPHSHTQLKPSRYCADHVFVIGRVLQLAPQMAAHAPKCVWWLLNWDSNGLVDLACLCRRGSDYQLPSTSAADTCQSETESNTELGLSLQVSALPSRDVHTSQCQQSSTNTAGKSEFQPMCPWQCSGFFQVLDPFLYSFCRWWSALHQQNNTQAHAVQAEQVAASAATCALALY